MRSLLLVSAVVGCSLLAWEVLRAQQPAAPVPPPPATQPAAPPLGSRLGNAIGRVGQGIAEAEAAVQQAAASARAKVDELGVEGRVYGRLHWDKALAGANFNIQANGKTVTLSGTAPDQAARNKAIDLAKSTIGVDQVVDQLSVGPATR